MNFIPTITITDDAPLEHTENGYECAAWWKSMKADNGTVQLNVIDHRYSGGKVLSGKFPATVVEDCFVSRIGSHYGKYDPKQNAGQPCDFIRTFAVDAFVTDPRFQADRPQVLDAYCDMAIEALQQELDRNVDWLKRELATEDKARDGILAHKFVTPPDRDWETHPRQRCG